MTDKQIMSTKNIKRTRLAAVSIFLVSLLSHSLLAEEPPNFQEHVLPIFKKHCLGCHNADESEAGLDLSSSKAALAGSSGGSVLKAGLPDSSPLYLSVTHHEDYAAMPPEKPKLASAELKTIREWIAGGLIATAGGKSNLREVSYDVSAGSIGRPDVPAFPESLPDVPLASTNVSPPILALACSPWTDLIAASGHKQILLYGEQPAAIEADGFEPVAKDALLLRQAFDDGSEEGVIGAAWQANGHRQLQELPNNFLNQHRAFSFTAWIKPDADMKGETIFGRGSFAIFLEKTRVGWRLRSVTRSKDNRVGYFGRQGEFPGGNWRHIAVTCDGKEWVFYYDGAEVSRQEIPANQLGFLDYDQPFFIGGDGLHKDRQYRGGLDDVRIYKRALSPKEVAAIHKNATTSLGHIGTLPFPEGDIHDLRFSRNGDLLIAAGGIGAESGKAVVYDVKTGRRIATLGDEYDIVLSADISADHKYVAIGTPAKLVKIFSTRTGELVHRIKKHTDWVTVVRFSPDGKQLATADRNGGIHVWETESAGIVYTLDEHKEKVTALSWRSDGKLLASAAEDGKFVLWDMKDGWATRAITAHAGKASTRYSRRTGILDIAFATDGRILTIGRDRNVRLWKPDGSRTSEVAEHSSLPLRAQFLSSGQLIATGAFDGQLRTFTLSPKMTPQAQIETVPRSE